MRFGYLALSHPDTMRQMSALLLPWNVGTIAMWAGMAALKDRAALREHVEYMDRERENFVKEWSKIPGMKVYPCRSNLCSSMPAARGRPARKS